MARMAVIRNKDGTVSCLPMWLFNKGRGLDVITIVNKQWNPYYIMKVKSYFKENKL